MDKQDTRGIAECSRTVVEEVKGKDVPQKPQTVEGNANPVKPQEKESLLHKVGSALHLTNDEKKDDEVSEAEMLDSKR